MKLWSFGVTSICLSLVCSSRCVAFSDATVSPKACQTPVSELRELCRRVNQIRQDRGLSSLTMDARLSAVAMVFAKKLYLYNHGTGLYLNHDLNGETYRERLAEGQVEGHWAAENIGAGQSSAAEIFQLWMGSPGHAENILSRDFRKQGLAHYGHFWVQEFTD